MFFQTLFELWKDLICWVLFFFNYDLTISNHKDDVLNAIKTGKMVCILRLNLYKNLKIFSY
jgi:hypothetical protein